MTIIDTRTPYLDRIEKYPSLENEISSPFAFLNSQIVLGNDKNRPSLECSYGYCDNREIKFSIRETRYLAALSTLQFLSFNEFHTLFHNPKNKQPLNQSVIQVGSTLKRKLKQLLKNGEPFFEEHSGYFIEDIKTARNTPENLVSKNGLTLNLITRILSTKNANSSYPHLTDSNFQLIHYIICEDEPTINGIINENQISQTTARKNISLLNRKLENQGYKIKTKNSEILFLDRI
jgi:hypothetical protein